jgi:lysophospholipase L1-like esterase
LNRRHWSVILAMVVAGACDTPTHPSSFGLNCPLSQAVGSPDGNPVAVNYTTPTTAGGEAPVTTSCSPASGSLVPLGSTLITCTARDAKQLTASCSFEVQVTAVPKVPRLSATKFVAFGDSITEGVTSTCDRTTAFMTFAETMLVLPKSANDPWTYPNVLQGRLRGTYSAQLPTVANRGSGGEELSAGMLRLPDVLSADRPEVLLLQEGANDVNQNVSPSTIATSLRSMVREGRGRGLPVYVGTLLPQRPLGVQGSCRGYGAANVVPANDQIRSMVATEGAVLVDLYQAFGAVPGTLIGPDGLHPSETGYQKIADTFFDAIKQRLEN